MGFAVLGTRAFGIMESGRLASEAAKLARLQIPEQLASKAANSRTAGLADSARVTFAS